MIDPNRPIDILDIDDDEAADRACDEAWAKITGGKPLTPEPDSEIEELRRAPIGS
jgi:hypothetical protein